MSPQTAIEQKKKQNKLLISIVKRLEAFIQSYLLFVGLLICCCFLNLPEKGPKLKGPPGPKAGRRDLSRKRIELHRSLSGVLKIISETRMSRKRDKCRLCHGRA